MNLCTYIHTPIIKCLYSTRNVKLNSHAAYKNSFKRLFQERLRLYSYPPPLVLQGLAESQAHKKRKSNNKQKNTFELVRFSQCGSSLPSIQVADEHALGRSSQFCSLSSSPCHAASSCLSCSSELAAFCPSWDLSSSEKTKSGARWHSVAQLARVECVKCVAAPVPHQVARWPLSVGLSHDEAHSTAGRIASLTTNKLNHRQQRDLCSRSRLVSFPQQFVRPSYAVFLGRLFAIPGLRGLAANNIS